MEFYFIQKAIETLIDNGVNNKEYTENDIFFHNERWHCFDAHSSLSNSSKEQLLFNLNEKIKFIKLYIQQSTHIVITFGTAWVYKYIENDKVVTNCHKVSQNQFNKTLLSVKEIIINIKNIESLLRSINPNIQTIYTVSPIRHLKDGFVKNQQSKSHLITAIHQVINDNSKYFPSYEIMMDELRDYRFYAEDMLHPNQTAINYIWDKFLQVWISTQASSTMEDVEIIQKGLLHKPFNSRADAYQQFLQELEEKKAKLQSKFPHIIF